MFASLDHSNSEIASVKERRPLHAEPRGAQEIDAAPGLSIALEAEAAA